MSDYNYIYMYYAHILYVCMYTLYKGIIVWSSIRRKAKLQAYLKLFLQFTIQNHLSSTNIAHEVTTIIKIIMIFSLEHSLCLIW